jgi:MFS family permease
MPREISDTSNLARATSLQASGEAPSALRIALAGLIGNVIEWFDFAVYGYFATDVGRQFFPKSSVSAQQLLAFGVFAIGFFARPIGSVALGWVGDRIGRRALLTISIALMGGATVVMGLLPTYAQIGLAAPILLVTMRVLQGFSVGGEFSGSMVFTTEASSPLMRGLVSSSTAAGVTIGFVLGSGSAWAINALLLPEQVSNWGWRIPLIASVLFCLAGWLLRRGLHETAEGLKAKEIRPPFISSIFAYWRPMLQTFGIVATTNASVLSDVHIHGGAPQRSHDRWLGLPAGTTEPDFCAPCQTFWWLVIGSNRPTQTHDHPDGRDDSFTLSSVPTHAVRHALRIRAGAGLACHPTRHGAGTSRRHVGRNFPVAFAGRVHEHRLQLCACGRWRYSPAYLGMAD